MVITEHLTPAGHSLPPVKVSVALQVTMTASCLIYSYIMMPIDPDAKAPILSVRHAGPVLQAWLVVGADHLGSSLCCLGSQRGHLWRDSCAVTAAVCAALASGLQAAHICLACCCQVLKSVSVLQAWLQELAWTEKEKPERLDIRNATLPDNEELRQAPMFCFETAIKMAYWSALVYDDKEVGNVCSCPI